MSIITEFAAAQKNLAATTRSVAQEAVDAGREVTVTIAGVDVALKYEGTSGRSTITTYSGVFLNGERFGTEYDVIPWSIFKEPTTFYNCGGLLLLEQAEQLIAAAGGAEDAAAVEEAYPTDEGPLRYYFEVRTLEAVVALFLALNPTLPQP